MKKEPAIVIANAIVWGAVILATAHALRGTDLFGHVLPILGGGASASLMLVGTSVINKKKPHSSTRDTP